MYSPTTEYQRASLTILPTANYNLPFMGHKLLYLPSLLVTCHQSSGLYSVMLSFMLIMLFLALQMVRRTDKSPLGQKPARTKSHWTISHRTILSPLLNLARWTKAHVFEKNRFKSFIKLLTLIRLLLQGKSHLQCQKT